MSRDGEASKLHSVLKSDIEKNVAPVPDAEWKSFMHQAKVLSFKRNQVVLHQTEICREILYIVDGVAASEYVVDGQVIISRFFQAHDFCTNMVSIATNAPGCDNIISLTPLHLLSIPINTFLEHYNGTSIIGRYMRDKVLFTLLHDKMITSSKTMLRAEDLDKFIRDTYPDIIQKVPSKYIARFMGITPEAYSRLRRRIQGKDKS